MKRWFIAGTDTGVGKTYVTVSLIHALQQAGYRVGAWKPVATGGVPGRNGCLENEDALRIRHALNRSFSYAQINPYVFAPPIAPHIAAAQAQTELSVAKLAAHYADVTGDIVLTEGVGGWFVPLNLRQRDSDNPDLGTETMADLAGTLDMSVILVVGIRLGCLNHALLTYAAVKRARLPCVGWYANCIEPDTLCLRDNIDALRTIIDAPLLGVVPYAPGSAYCRNIAVPQKLATTT